jgi:NADPH2:quinone reductase
VKAVLCKEYGPPESLVVEDIAPLQPGRGQVVVGVRACGVNFADILMIQGRYQVRPPVPFSPGFEVAGIVKEVGEDVEDVHVGSRVIAFIHWGGYAEEVVADAATLIPMPDSMDFPTAAAFVVAYGTAHYALTDRAQLKPGETLLVLGAAGGVGLAAVEVGKVSGARVIAAAASDEKLAVCKQHGADDLINYRTEDMRERIKQLTDEKGVDVAFDPVGGGYAETVLRNMAWGGRYLVIGFAAGDIPRISLNLPLLKGCAIVGVFWGQFIARERPRCLAYLHELLAWFAAGKIKPLVSATYPLACASDALYAVLNRTVWGKVVLRP